MHSLPDPATRRAEIHCRLEAIATNARNGTLGLLPAVTALAACGQLAEKALEWLDGEVA